MNYTNIIEKENSIILENVKDFNIKQILECGQCFRWERMTDTDYIIVAYRRVIEVIQEGSTVTILNTNMKDFNEIWKQYFDLEVNYGEIKEELSKDELLSKFNFIKNSLEFGQIVRAKGIVETNNGKEQFDYTLSEISMEKIVYRGESVISFIGTNLNKDKIKKFFL